jgi:hypothetical protein
MDFVMIIGGILILVIAVVGRINTDKSPDIKEEKIIRYKI